MSFSGTTQFYYEDRSPTLSWTIILLKKLTLQLLQDHLRCVRTFTLYHQTSPFPGGEGGVKERLPHTHCYPKGGLLLLQLGLLASTTVLGLWLSCRNPQQLLSQSEGDFPCQVGDISRNLSDYRLSTDLKHPQCRNLSRVSKAWPRKLCLWLTSGHLLSFPWWPSTWDQQHLRAWALDSNTSSATYWKPGVSQVYKEFQAKSLP